MRLLLVTPGRIKKPYLQEGCNDYLRRIRRYVPFDELEVREEPVTGGVTPELVRRREGERLQKAIPTGAYRILLDEHGRDLGSVALAEHLQRVREQGRRDLCFVIGGPLGLDPTLRTGADLVLSLSAMTLPHELARLVLLEQVYRAFTILRGEPYHNP